MGNWGDTQTFTLGISAASLLIALVSLLLNLKTRRAQLNSYFITRHLHRSSAIDLKYVSTEQLEGDVLIKLVLFNPGSTAAIIQSLTVYRKCPLRFRVMRWFGAREWEELRSAKWWPTSDPSCKEQKTLADEYKSLYVEDYRDIYVRLPGYIDRNEYGFSIETNHGELSHCCTVNAIESYFPYAFHRSYREA